MEDNNLFHNRYFLERLLGRGYFSEVWLAKDIKTDIYVAIKIYAPATGLDDHGLNVFAREFALVVNANHKNLLKPLYYDSCERKPYLVLPYCKNGSILKNIGQFNEGQIWKLIRDIASGLAWLHNLTPAIIHQDIKPDNIMVGDNGDYMITDFGVSTHLKSTLRKSISSAFSSAGTIAYMAPERFGEDKTPIMANDIYSLGATSYEMLTGDTPFGDEGGLLQKKGADVPLLQGNYSNQLKKTIALCLRQNPWERPTAEQLVQYAETAMKGGKIEFKDDGSNWMQKYKWHLGAIAFILCLFILGVFVFQGNENVSVANTIGGNTISDSTSVVNNQADRSESAEAKGDSVIRTGENTQDSKKVLSPKKKKPKEMKEKEEQNDEDKLTTIPVTKQPTVLSINPTSVHFKGKGGKTVQIEVMCNSHAWKITKMPSWVKCTIIRNVIMIEAEKNTTKEERRGALIVKCEDKRAQVNIIQARIKVLGIF